MEGGPLVAEALGAGSELAEVAGRLGNVRVVELRSERGAFSSPVTEGREKEARPGRTFITILPMGWPSAETSWDARISTVAHSAASATLNAQRTRSTWLLTRKSGVSAPTCTTNLPMRRTHLIRRVVPVRRASCGR